MSNRLVNESSPYLRQHAENPVDWYPWGEEAFAKARAEGKPIFLSVGYSSCHWCHVMAHESFEDADVAQALNESYVSVKVDREERPDVDEAYMTFVQLLTGRGGWPMSVFLTPDRKPFFGGTYWPKDDRAGHLGFRSLSRQLARAWRTNRQDIEKSADEYAQAMRDALVTRAPGTFATLTPDLYAQAVRAQAASFDGVNGGFGGAPKFPPHTALEFLMAYPLSEFAPDELREIALGMSLVTLQQMALGGIHDHVGGGFHRYSTDGEWRLPHFEKMLYDNALMLGNYARGALIAREVQPELTPDFERVIDGIVGWLRREMTAPDGTFYSALDADSEGEEGKFYVWTEGEIREVLGSDAEPFLNAFDCLPEGNYLDEATGLRTGANVLYAKEPVADRFSRQLAALQVWRERRPRPGLDDKALVGWNGLAIGGLAEAGALPMAATAAAALLEYERAHGRLPHQIVNGQPSGEAFLEDYAFLIDGLTKVSLLRNTLEAHAASLAPNEAQAIARIPSASVWEGEARRLMERMVADFYDEDAGAFFGQSTAHEALFGRTKPVFDQPVPSANAVAIRALVTLGEVDRAHRAAEALVGWMERAPQATEALYYAAMPFVGTEVPAETPAKPVTTEVRVSLEPREIVAGSDGAGRGVVRLSVPEGVHINSNTPAARWLTPTSMTFEPLKATVAYPAGDEFENYLGEVEIPFSLELPSGERAAEFEIRVVFQPCTDTECLLPVERRLDGVLLRA